MGTLINKFLNTIIACTFLTSAITQDISFADEPGESHLSVSAITQDPIRARALLAEEYRQSRLAWSFPPDSGAQNRYTRLLGKNYEHAMLFPSGRYVMTEDTKDDDLLLIRAITHADYETLMQMERKHHKTRYHRLSQQLLSGDEFKEARALHRDIAHPIEDKNTPFLFNHMIATAWELVFLIDKGYVIPGEELSPEERRFADIMRPVLYERNLKGNYKNFSSAFFDPAERMRTVLRIQKDPARPRILRRSLPARPLSSMAIAVSLMDIGVEITGDDKITHRDSIEKLIEIIPELARDRIGKIYLYGGVYPTSELSMELHQVPTPEKHFLHHGKAVVLIENYDTKRKQVGNIFLRDSFGNSFSIGGLDRWNPKLSSGDVDAEMRRLIDSIHASGMKAVVDFVPWLSPDAIDENNYRWTFYRELTDAENKEFRKTPKERKAAWMESVVDKNREHCAVRIDENGRERVILVKHLAFYGSHSRDQVLLNPFVPEVRNYYRRALKRLIDTGFDEVRVDLPGLLLGAIENAENYPADSEAFRSFRAQLNLWDNLIRYAKGYANRHGKKFGFNMESYDSDEQGRFFAFGARAVYDSGLFHAFWQIVREGGLATAFDNPVKKALWKDSRSLIFPSNFDQMSLKAIGGAREAYMMLIIALTHLGVSSMVDLREYLGHTGHVIPIVGGSNDNKDGHPFISESEFTARRDFEATKRAIADAPFKKLVEDFYAAVDTREERYITILNNADTRRYFSIGWVTERGDWQVLLLDMRPQDKKEGPVKVELPEENRWIDYIPSQFAAVDSRDKNIRLPITRWNPDDPKSPAVAVVPFEEGKEYTFFRLVPAKNLRESVERLNKTVLESVMEDTGKSEARPLPNSLASLKREARGLKSITKLRFVVPMDVLKNSADIAMAFEKIGINDPAFRRERIPFELVVTGVRDRSDIRLIEALKSNEAKEVLGLTGDLTISMITEYEIWDVPKRDNRFGHNASTPSGRARIVKDMITGTLADGEYACIVTDAADDLSAQKIVREFERESISSERIAVMVPVKSGAEREIFLLSQIVSEWFGALNTGNGSAVRRILPPMISPAELMRRLSDSMHAVWIAASAA